MKKVFVAFMSVALVAAVYSCKNNGKSDESETTSVTEETDAPANESSTTNSSTAQPQTFTYTASPDTVLLGKKKEAAVKIIDLKAIELSDPDGKATGLELTYKIELTNRNKVGANQSVGINTSHFRLELDNGQKIAPQSVYVSAAEEETKISDEDTFEVPAGAKPVALSLFLDDTRATVKLEQK